MYIAAENGHLDVAKYLLDNGASQDPTGNSTTPLNTAALGGHLDLVKLLIHYGANHDPNTYGQTPLIGAAVRGHLDVVRFFQAMMAQRHCSLPQGMGTWILSSIYWRMEPITVLTILGGVHLLKLYPEAILTL